jgi:hypothetical protein
MRPGNELTAGSLNVLGAVDTLTSKIDRFTGISIVAITLFYYETTATKKRRIKIDKSI